MSDLFHTLLAFLVAIGLLVVFHEWGHYLVARAFGVRVLRFSVGFGRPLLTWRGRTGTEWVVAAIPLGGYVQMLDGREGAVPPEARREAFDSKPPPVRLAIVAAGPLANFVLAILLYALVGMVGVEEPVAVVDPSPESPAAQAGIAPGDRIVAVEGEPATTWPQVRWRLVATLSAGAETVLLRVERADGTEATRFLPLAAVALDPDAGDPLRQLGLQPQRPAMPPVVGAVAPDSPAAAIGLQPGDRLVALDGIPLADWQEVVTTVRDRPGKAVMLTWQRAGQEQSATLTLAVGRDDEGREIGRLGVQPAPVPWLTQRVVYGPLEAFGYGWRKTVEVATLTLRVLAKMVVGEASVKNLSGPLTLATAARASAELGIAHYLALVALVSVSLAVFNLLPIPVLDGGHLLYYFWEWVLGRPLPEGAQRLGQRFGLLLLGLVMAIALFNDLLRWLG